MQTTARIGSLDNTCVFTQTDFAPPSVFRNDRGRRTGTVSFNPNNTTVTSNSKVEMRAIDRNIHHFLLLDEDPHERCV